MVRVDSHLEVSCQYVQQIIWQLAHLHICQRRDTNFDGHRLRCVDGSRVCVVLRIALPIEDSATGQIGNYAFA